MTIYNTQNVNTINITNAGMSGAGALGDLIVEAVPTFFLDYDGVTNIDGVLLSLFTNRTNLIDNMSGAGPFIISASPLGFYKGSDRWLIVPSTEVNPVRGEGFSIGNFATYLYSYVNGTFGAAGNLAVGTVVTQQTTGATGIVISRTEVGPGADEIAIRAFTGTFDDTNIIENSGATENFTPSGAPLDLTITPYPANNIGVISNNNIGFFIVESVDNTTSPRQFIVRTKKLGLSASDFTYALLFRTHQYMVSAELGYLTLNLGQNISGAKVRAALIWTNDPASGDDYPTRFANNEVIWSKFYPIGTQINVDFSGVAIQDTGFIPPIINLAPATGTNAEKRLMLALYWESGTPIAFTFDMTLTYRTKEVVDTNG